MAEPIRVLHVEDEPAFADLTATFLTQEIDDIDIDSVTSAQEALERIDTTTYDCVISDFDMPVMNGIELLDRVREGSDELPFILFTGKGSEEVASEAISSGVTDYLQKGSGRDRFEILANQVVNAVEKVRASRRAQRMKARFQSLSAAFPDVAFYIDEHGEYLDVVAGEESPLLYEEAESLVGKRFHEVLDDETADRFLEAVLEAIETESMTDIEYQLDVQAGSRWFEGLISPIEKPRSDRNTVIWVARDITERKQREQELQETRKRYETILEQSSDYVLIVDATGQVSYASPAVERVMEYSPDELIGMNAFEFVHEDDHGLASEAFESLLDGPNEEVSIEFRAITKHGDQLWLEVRGRNLFDDPTIDGILVNVRDITDRRKPEIELHEMEQRFDLALEGADAGVWEWNVETGELIWSDELLSVLGLASSDFDNTIEFFEDRMHPADREHVQEAIDKALETGELYRTEQRLKHADGQYVWFEVRGRVIEDEGERKMVGIGIDISGRKQRERELERYRKLIQTAGDGIYELDTEGRFSFVNQALCELSGYDRADLIGNPGTVLMSEEDFERGTDLIQSLLDQDRNRGTFEMDIQTTDGEIIPCGNHITLLFSNGEFRGTAGIVRDISDRKEREETLERQNERLEEFARVVSHDLRNPLTVAMGRVELAEEEAPSEHHEPLADSLERMNELIDDLMALATAGEDVSEMEAVDLEATVTNAWSNVETAEATYTVEDNITIIADSSRFLQLLENLIRNAVEHGGRDVTITVGDLPDGFYLEDDGDGIDPEHRHEVFEEGYSTAEEGTGSGLSIVKQIADAHDWEVVVAESTSGGARFEFTGVERSL